MRVNPWIVQSAFALVVMMNGDRSSNDAYYSGVSPIRNRLKQFSRDGLVERLLTLLAHVEGAEPREMATYPPWCTALLLKWTLAYAPERGRKEPGREQVLRLLQATKDLEPAAGLPDRDRLHTFMRSVLYQQRTAHMKANRPDIARQELLFGSLPDSHTIAQQVRMAFGLPMRDVLDLSFATTAAFFDRPSRSVTREFFAPLGKEWSAVDGFLESICLDLRNAAREIRVHCGLDASDTRRNLTHRSSEFRERPIFSDRPLFRRGRAVPSCVQADAL